jgi:hypothetical protein
LKKLFEGENIASACGKKVISLLLFTFLLSVNITAQIPINGFCRLNKAEASAGFNSLFTLSLKNDPYTDVALFNPDKKLLEIFEGDIFGGLTLSGSVELPEEISKVQPLFKQKKFEGYAAVSRKNRTLSLLKVVPESKIKIDKRLLFSSYPDNISAADVNRNGSQEILISGSAFDGLSIIKNENDKFVEKKIIERTSFSNAVFAEISNNGFPDIAAFDITSNNIDIFYNDGRGNFRKVRSIPQHYAVTSLRSFDLNSDYYDDLIFIKNNKIHIYYGDYSSGYSNKIIVNTNFTPHRVIFGDYNKDGRIDIAYINNKEGIVSILFAKDDYQFHPEIIYLQKKGIKNIVPYYSKFINGIAAVSEDGEVYTLTHLQSISSETSLSIGASPGLINYFDYENNGITDICYFDEFNGTLNFLIRSDEGIFKLYFSVNVYDDYTSLVVDNKSPLLKTFICYNEGRRKIEVVTIDFSSFSVARRSLYSPGGVKELSVSKAEREFNDINILYESDGKLSYGTFDYFHGKYRFKNKSNFEGEIAAANILSSNSESIVFIKQEEEAVSLYKRNFEKLSVHPEKLSSTADIPGSKKIFTTEDLLNKNEIVPLLFFTTNKNIKAILSRGGEFSVLNVPDLAGDLIHLEKRFLFFGERQINGIKKLFAYIPVSNSFYEFNFKSNGREIIPVKLFSGLNIKSFFIKNLNTRNIHLVYTNKEDKCINILPLP